MGRVARLLHRDWPRSVAQSMHDLRICAECCALVDRWNTRGHENWHRDLDEQVSGSPEAMDPGGYVVGEGRTEDTIDYYAGDHDRR